MARILENPTGRRMIHLSADDELNVVQFYQQQVHGLPHAGFSAVKARLQQTDCFLPEEV